MNARLIYLHDPMCSWCWGFKPTWEKVKTSLPEGISYTNILGGLAPDSNEPMPDELRQMIRSTWQTIHQQLGTPFNFDFWEECEPRRSTYPACRAVLAAAEQGAEEAMILAIQEGYYLNAQNPSDEEVLVRFAEALGLNIPKFREHLQSSLINTHLMEHIQIYQQLPARGFPSLVLLKDDQAIPLALNYQSSEKILAEINDHIQ
ncbi:DsbA family protein [Endozoicomonas numazuensis]|uniref:Thioredoxin n=1 Tax=Endozoicomonas numazuensis TaxID=1137799 RepID=A0A081NCZ0_9GAMM|nr:DsbA family protein [Endozoicomonas numazuensis]KEQ16313.1 thioredoxin [Endozoicomonas numazuensis]